MVVKSQVDDISEDYRIKISYNEKKAMFNLCLFDENGNYLNEFDVSLFALLELTDNDIISGFQEAMR